MITVRRPAARSRIVGIDVARGVAILGMFAAHVIPRPDDAELLVDGRSSILFATLAGVSLGIMTGSEHPLERGRRGRRVTGILIRALILLVLGIALGLLDSGVAVILDFYAVMFLLVTPILFLPRPVLAGIAATFALGAPVLATLAGDNVEGALGGTLPETLNEASGLVGALRVYLLTGYYPALIWVPFLLVGLICARSGLGRAGTQVAMMTAGTGAAVLGYGAGWFWPGVSAAAHSGSTAEIVGSGGLAITIIGVLLWLTSPGRGGFGTAVRGVTWPIGATGSMALTIYTLQILTLAAIVALRDTPTGAPGVIAYPGWPLLITLSIASLLFAALWRALLGKGPLERMLAAATRLRPRRRDGYHT